MAAKQQDILVDYKQASTTDAKLDKLFELMVGQKIETEERFNKIEDRMDSMFLNFRSYFEEQIASQAAMSIIAATASGQATVSSSTASSTIAEASASTAAAPISAQTAALSSTAASATAQAAELHMAEMARFKEMSLRELVLRGMTLHRLKSKALGMGVTRDRVDDLDSKEDPKEAAIALLMAKSQVVDPERLRGMRLKQLKQTALGMGVTRDTVDDLDATEDPKEAAIALLKAKAEEFDPEILRGMTLKKMKDKALGMGVSRDTVDDLDNAGDPRKSAIALIMATAQVLDPEYLRAHTLKQLWRHARVLGITDETLDDLNDEDNPKEALIPLIMAKAQEALLEKSKKMSLKELKEQAREMGVTLDTLDDVDDTGCPKEATIALIIAKSQESDPAGILRGEKLNDLKNKALAMRVARDTVDDLCNKEDPKESPIKQILAEKEQLWRETFRGDVLEPVLLSGAILLLDALWVVLLGAQCKVLDRRQELPSTAFASLAMLKETCCKTSLLPIIALSYPWLSKSHPDPNGDHVRFVAEVLATLIDTGISKYTNWGVFWDFGSLHQHGEHTCRTDEEDRLFRSGLAMLGTMYSHPWTWVFRLTQLPADLPTGANTRTYAERGWTFTESSWSQLSKSRFNSLDLGLVSGSTSNWHVIRERCTAGGGRRPPLTPARFQEELSTKVFTNEKDDKPLVFQLYKEAFEQQMGSAKVLNYSDLDWTEDDFDILCEVIESGALKSLEILDLSGQVVGIKIAQRFHQAMQRGQLPRCCRILHTS